MAKRRKIITAGRLVKGTVYTAINPLDAPRIRSEKLKMSSAARERMNLKMSWEKLEMLLAANFAYSDLHVTLTYSDEYLPPNRDAGVKFLKKFIRELRAARRLRGDALIYIYSTEDKHGDARLHHHIVVNATGEDYEMIRSLWTHGDNVDIELVGVPGYTVLAQYLTKEPREYGKAELGARTWTPSLGLKKPKTEASFVPDNMTLTAPPGAIILDKGESRNDWGEFIYIKYLLQEPAVPLPARYLQPQRKARKKE